MAEIGKKFFLLSANSTLRASEIISSYFKDKTIKITETILPQPLKFKFASSVCTLTKFKETVISFTTESNMSGKIDIALLPIELV